MQNTKATPWDCETIPNLLSKPYDSSLIWAFYLTELSQILAV